MGVSYARPREALIRRRFQSALLGTGAVLGTSLVACVTESDGRHEWTKAFADVSANERTCVARVDGKVQCWGVGIGNLVPFTTQKGDGDFVRVGHASECVYALTDAHELKSVASNTRCQAPPVGKQRDFSVGDTTCSIADDDTMRCWSSRSGSKVCVPGRDGTQRCFHVEGIGPVEPFPDEHFRRVAAGGRHSCAIRSDFKLRCWGPVNAGVPPEGQWVDVAVGNGFGCAIDTAGAAACWSAAPMPEIVPPPGVRFSRIAARNERVCAVEEGGGAVRCWGKPFRWNAWTFEPPSGAFVDVSVGTNHACARKANGDAACWGVNQQGQVTGKAPSRFFRN